MSVPRLRSYEGPRRRPIHSAFFLLGSIYSGAVIPLRLGVFAGRPCPPRALRHATGTTTKCCSATSRRSSVGFLLTAAPNCTGRLPLQGTLLVPGSTWLAGRNAVVLPSSIG